MKKIIMFVLSALAIVSAATASNPTKVAKSSPSNFMRTAAEEETDTIADAIVTQADVNVKFTNDATYPWGIFGATVGNGNYGKAYSSSTLTMNYSSSYKTELTFDWCCYNYNYHSLRLFVDGVQMNSTTNSSYTSIRLYVEPGQHVIVFKDSIGNSTGNNWSRITNLKVRETSPLEKVVLTENSKPLTFTNDGTWPWTIEDGYVQSSNYGTANSASKFSTSFTIDSVAILSFQIRSAYINGNGNFSTSYSGNGYHRFNVYINGDWNYNRFWDYSTSFSTFRVPLEQGTYTVEWEDTIYNSTNKYLSQVSNIQLLRDWTDVELASPGTLGVEVLYKVNVLNDVAMLKVKGMFNSSDWNDIKNMKNLVALDLSEATFTSVPDYAFNGLSLLSWVKLPEGVNTIGKCAFKGTQIFAIDIPSTVTSIGQMAFANTRITKCTFKEDSQLSTIAVGAFYKCTSLDEIIMPNTVSSVGAYAFEGCTNLKTLLFSDAITGIPNNICYDCTSLTTLHLPDNVQEIGYRSFYNTSSLRNVDMPSTVNRIHDYAFYNCGLDSLKLPITMQYLHSYAFSDCLNLKYIELPSYLEVGSGSFTYYYPSDDNNYRSSYSGYYGYYYNFQKCTSITTVVMRSATPPSYSYDPFYNARAKSAIILKVPSFAVVNYKLDNYWYQFGSIVEGDDIDYWKITSSLSLTNNRRMNGKPDIDLYYGGQFTVGGNAPMEIGQFNVFVGESNPARLLNTCDMMTADSINSNFYATSETWFFITPLHDVDLSKVTVSNGASYVFRYYDGSNRATNGTGNSWRNVDNGKLIAGQGYIFRCNANAVVTFPAEASVHAQVFNTADVTIPLNEYEAASSANKSWNFVGNPYPCYFDIYYMDFTAPITVWTGSTYKAYSIVDDNLALRPMQSFFVQKPDAVDNIVFHKEGRQLTTSINHAAAVRAFRAPAVGNRIFFNLHIAGNGEGDETRVVINDNASPGYELERDASKFMSFELNVPQIFTLDDNGSSYAINERPLGNGIVNLAYYAGQSGIYTLSVTRADGDIYLHDAQLNQTVNLKEQDYTFHSDATEGTNNTRFTLSLSISDEDATEIKTIESNKSGNDDFYDLQGRKILNTPKKGIYIYNGRKVVK